jgi:transcriptional regulator with XRE-family HTH domain
MRTFGEKVALARYKLKLSQAELGKKIGVSLRSVYAYEKNEKMPRKCKLLLLAEVLKVSTKYLLDEDCEDPLEDIERDPYYSDAQKRYGIRGMTDVEALLNANKALFAGGELSQEQKDAFFEAVMSSYVICKEAAKIKFTPKTAPGQTGDH